MARATRKQTGSRSEEQPEQSAQTQPARPPTRLPTGPVGGGIATLFNLLDRYNRNEKITKDDRDTVFGFQLAMSRAVSTLLKIDAHQAANNLNRIIEGKKNDEESDE